jgi:glycosyltransferase involved in cell wall biosynthesis
VVDNGSQPVISQEVESNRQFFMSIQYLPEPALGLHNARHTGVRFARGDLLVFTDDDATFDPNWLQAYAQAFLQHPEMVAAGGPVRPIWEETPPQWLLNYIGDSKSFEILSLMEPYSDFHLDPKGYFFGVNMAIRKEVLLQMGGFNPDSFGDIWLGDGESGLNIKLWESNLLVGYVPDAIVYHHIPPSRTTIEYFMKRMANQGSADIYTECHKNMPAGMKLFWRVARLVRTKTRLWLSFLFVRGRKDRHSIYIQMQAVKSFSQLIYLIRLMYDTKLRKLILRTDWIEDK